MYIGNSYSQGDDIRYAVIELQEFKIPKPKREKIDSDDDSDAEEFVDMLYKQEVKEYVTRRNKYQSNVKKAFNLVWGQCTDSMQAKLEGRENFGKVKLDLDVVEL